MHPTWEQLADYIDKRLSETEADQITRHLSTCEQCAAELEWMDDTTHSLRGDLFVAPPRTVRMAAELAFERRPSAVVSAMPLVETLPATTPPPPSKVITPPTSYWRRSLGIVVAVAAVLVLWIFAAQSQNRPIVAAVASSQGQVEVQQGQAVNTILSGNALSEGSAVRTGDDGTAQLAFGAGAVEVVMLGDSHIIYQNSVVDEGGYRQVNLVTDTAGDLELNAQDDVTIHLQTGIGLVETTGGRFRFHYLEPKIVALNVVRGVVTVTNQAGDVYDLDEGEHVLDYSQPDPTHTPAVNPTSTPQTTATPAPTTPTRLPTRAVPTITSAPSPSGNVVPSDDHGSDDNGSSDHSSTSGSSGGSFDATAAGGSIAATTTPPFVPPVATTTSLPVATSAPVEPEPDDNSGSGSSDGEHSDNRGSGSGGSEHDDNSGSGSGGSKHDDNSGSGGGGNDHSSR